jgi:hypothetical protein
MSLLGFHAVEVSGYAASELTGIPISRLVQESTTLAAKT